ncbi:hypothetical protein Tco_0983564 [Tanacetum coccineum]
MLVIESYSSTLVLRYSLESLKLVGQEPSPSPKFFHTEPLSYLNPMKEEEKRIEEEQAAKARYWKILVCYNDDDDEEISIPLKDTIIYGLPPCVAITPTLSTEELVTLS